MAARPNIYTGERFVRERCDGGTYPRHRHRFDYICVVLSGQFIEAGDMGRFRLGAGDVLVHRSFEAHMDVFGRSAVDVLNLPLPDGILQEGLLRCSNPDAVAIEAERDPLSAAMMMASTSTAALGEQDWPDLLAHALRCDPGLSIKRWADRHGLASGTVSRGFGQAYGTSPARFRLESRAREACRAVTATAEPCAMIAADLGFADQAHMSRAVKQLSGLPPAQLRTSASNRFKTIQR